MTRYAGAWGVPYFTFTSERGSTCTNNFTGYTCEPLTLAEVEFYGDLDLPDDTRVISGNYNATHDYRLEASLRMLPAPRRPGCGPCSKNSATASRTTRRRWTRRA